MAGLGELLRGHAQTAGAVPTRIFSRSCARRMRSNLRRFFCCSRLLHPLTGSTSWVEYEGTTVVRKVWDGRANLVELVADGPAGHFEGLNLRLYNPQSRQWSLYFANSRSGTMSPPTVGGFQNGRGEFFSQETLDGRAILVRFVISDITPNSCRFEQAFSEDGGKTWEVNWIATDTRIMEESGQSR